MVFDIGYSFDMHLLYEENSLYPNFLLILISVDIPATIINYPYSTVMFHVSWCRLMIIYLLIIGSTHLHCIFIHSLSIS